MREIKFRAKTKDGVWFYWNITDPIDMESMKDAMEWETLGQFTGLKDKNGKDIFEGDIIKKIKKSSGDIEKKSVVVCDRGAFWAYVGGWDKSSGGIVGLFGGEVIGNIYENLELL